MHSSASTISKSDSGILALALSAPEDELHTLNQPSAASSQEEEEEMEKLEFISNLNSVIENMNMKNRNEIGNGNEIGLSMSMSTFYNSDDILNVLHYIKDTTCMEVISLCSKQGKYQ